jgi:hypothetical protein
VAVMIKNHMYPRRCFLIGHSKCLVKGDYHKCKMMREIQADLFIVPDDRPIYDEQECEHFRWR